MITQKEKVVPTLRSAETDLVQPPSLKHTSSIADKQREFNNRLGHLEASSLTEIYDTIYQPKEEIIEMLLCSGVYLFVGAPKLGKSFFMAQLGYHVSNGLSLWKYKTNRGAVLYLALEDGYTRIQKRLSKMFGMETVDNFYFATQAKNLKDGLDKQLSEFMAIHPETKLIIIDTLQKIRELGGEKYSYSNDYEIVTSFKKFADEHNICVLLVHHTRKQSSDDCFDTISGTTGLLGAADGAFILQKEKRTANKAILDITSRDFQDQRLHLSFDRERCLWELEKAETEQFKEEPDELVRATVALLSPDEPEWVGTASELIERLSLNDINPNVLTRRLNVAADLLWNQFGIRLEKVRLTNRRVIRLTLEKVES